ncbi:hypothetical protein JX265_000189 [Neoarthrinium moseri]|uniref:Uncharacterized protein n=1 Tax=Neoarthrinium moseri TaxID=1658444 RepID=A0A9P9WY05_9PEZI|nr:uncharacterized protein JN550_001111 [Neoarthrinium moseri]KAI1853312.1 hypothetical protein JX266_002018 [Neoarthrinium moseri]KAI1877039.1 hypothetical protein JN550_001111 [Neoarthrinium moseri]KAI1881363.1 hypothetical protein JX265_000189 [Neoarthrinium moseri]
MDHVRPNVGGGAGGQPLRPVVRHRGLAVLALATTAVVAGVQYKKRSMQRNEQAQKNSGGSNYYVSVDRSGGGI